MTKDEYNERFLKANEIRFVYEDGEEDYMLIVDGNDQVIGRVEPYGSTGRWEFNGKEFMTKKAAINAARAEYMECSWQERDHIEMLKEVLEKQFPDLGQKER